MSKFICIGWCVLETACGDDETTASRYAVLESAGRHVRETWGHYFHDLTVDCKNDECFVTFHVARNRPNGLPEIVYEMFEYLAAAAPLSIGIAHMFDTEHAEAFTVLKLLGPEIKTQTDRELARIAST